MVNSRNWNSKIDNGLSDWFIPYFEETHSILTYQEKIYNNEKPWIGKIYYNPSAFWGYWRERLYNKIYKIFNPTALLSKESFQRMHSGDFLSQYSEGELLNAVSNSFKKFYNYNALTQNSISEKKQYINIPDNYISIHIIIFHCLFCKFISIMLNITFIKSNVHHQKVIQCICVIYFC